MARAPWMRILRRYRGREEIDRIAGAIKATRPDFSYQLLAEPEEVGDIQLYVSTYKIGS
jgi:hypothetical protein